MIALECVRLWARQGPAAFVLVARDGERTEAIARELRVEHPAAGFDVLMADFNDPESIRQVAERASAEAPPDIILIAHGARPEQADCEADLDACRAALLINGVSPALFAESFAGRLEKAGAGVLVVIGSITGDRGRRSNYVYGAAKGLLERYTQGLAHRLVRRGVRVVLIKPGPTDTPQTVHLRGTGKRLARPASVAAGIVRAAEGGPGVVYLPFKWWPIMLVIRHMPAFLFNRLDI